MIFTTDHNINFTSNPFWFLEWKQALATTLSYKYCNWQISGIARQTLFMMFVYNCEFSPPPSQCSVNIYFVRKTLSGSARTALMPESAVSENVFVQIVKYLCLNCQVFLSKLSNVFVQIVKYLCPNFQMYLSKLSNVFVQIVKYLCPNCQVYLSKLSDVYFQVIQINKCIFPTKCVQLRKNHPNVSYVS